LSDLSPPADISGRRVVVTGAHSLASGLASWFAGGGADVVMMAEPEASAPSGVTLVGCDFGSANAVRRALEASTEALGGLDQVVHAWMAHGLIERVAFMDVDEATWLGRCERSLEATWWLSQHVIGPLRAAGGGSVVYLVPSVGLTGAAGFSLLATVAEGIRVLAKGCGRQWGKHHVTANIVVTEPGLWVGSDAAYELFRSISLSVPAFADVADPGEDMGPLVSVLGDASTHYLTASTLVADGGIWMGL
jgi:3-oxoacyl-[acyl-carrier protein] reductase